MYIYLAYDRVHLTWFLFGSSPNTIIYHMNYMQQCKNTSSENVVEAPGASFLKCTDSYGHKACQYAQTPIGYGKGAGG